MEKVERIQISFVLKPVYIQWELVLQTYEAYLIVGARHCNSDVDAFHMDDG